MPRALLRSESTVFARASSLCILLLLPFGCERQSPPAPGPSARARTQASAEPARVRRPAPSGSFDCRELRPAPTTEAEVTAETLELRPPGAGKTVFTSKTGVLVMFDREDFLKAARCLKLEKAVRYIEDETGQTQRSALMDTWGMSYVVAALLDAGRAGVRLEEEAEWRKSIVRDRWAADGCSGRCRSFGRLYRVSESEAAFFLRITDHTRNDWE